MATSKRLGLAMSALALAVTGCTTSATGQPTSAPDGSSSGSPTTSGKSSDSSSPTVEIPPRPRDISLDGLDPCTLYTEAQRAELKVDDVKSGESDSKSFAGMKECALNRERQEPYIEYSALAVTTEGVEVWLSGGRNADAELTSIQGFPAAKFKFLGVEDEGCDIAVGVGDKQYLWVGVYPYSKGFEQDQLCQMAEQATNMAMTTLQSLK